MELGLDRQDKERLSETTLNLVQVWKKLYSNDQSSLFSFCTVFLKKFWKYFWLDTVMKANMRSPEKTLLVSVLMLPMVSVIKHE